MGVYIKGMKMPSQCYDCYIVANDYDKDSLYCRALDEDIEDWNSRLSNCPLIEVTEPHGKLIEEAEVRVIMHQVCVRSIRTYEATECAIRNMKAVIEAEGE